MNGTIGNEAKSKRQKCKNDDNSVILVPGHMWGECQPDPESSLFGGPVKVLKQFSDASFVILRPRTRQVK